MFFWLFWVPFTLTTVIGGNALVARHVRTLERKCACTCGEIRGYWPWIQRDMPQYLRAGETAKDVWFVEGMLFCTPDATRIQEVQDAIDLDTKVRLLKQDAARQEK